MIKRRDYFVLPEVKTIPEIKFLRNEIGPAITQYAPVILSMDCESPVCIGGTCTVTATVSWEDPNGDLSGGQKCFRLRRDSAIIDQGCNALTDPCATGTSGTCTENIDFDNIAGYYIWEIWVVDQAGHESNHVSCEWNIGVP